MRPLLTLILAMIAAVVLVVLGLWLALTLAPQLADSDTGGHWVWVCRCAATAVAAAAQVVSLAVISPALFRRGAVSQSLGTLAALLCTGALVGTLALI